MRLPVFFLILFFVFTKSIQAGTPITTYNPDSANSKFISFKSDNYNTKLTKSNKNPKWINDYKTFRFAVQGGFSYLVAPVSEFVPKDLVQHVKKLKTGMHYGVDIGLLPFEQFGFGAKYINFITKNSNDIRTDKIQIRYFGPVIMNRFFSHDKNSLVLVSISGGYMAYKNDIKTYSELKEILLVAILEYVMIIFLHPIFLLVEELVLLMAD